MAEIIMRDGNSLNNLEKNNSPKKSHIKVRKQLAQTIRFGEITPFFAWQGIPDDENARLRSKLNLRTFTLQSPLMADLTMHKNNFLVPYESILPFNWKSKIYPIPTLGDDVPQDAYTEGDYSNVIESFFNIVGSSLPSSLNGLSPARKSYVFSWAFSCAVMMENIFSSGSLANTLGYGISRCDFAFPNLDPILSGSSLGYAVRSLTLDGDIEYSYDAKSLCTNDAKSLANDYLLYFDFRVSFPSALESVYSEVYTYLNSLNQFFQDAPADVLVCDLMKLYAYQVTCAHFYSNDKVDFVYSAELWRQHMASLIDAVSSAETFLYNGSDIPYDWLSSSVVRLYGGARYVATGDPSLVSSSISLKIFSFWNHVFGYRRSLKFEDYFTGARPRPLAVGNTTIPVTGSGVSVIDVSRNIQMQRLLNQVNRVGRKFSNYVNGLFGKVPDTDWHDPKFISHSSEVVYGSETENTGSEQFMRANSVTTTLRCNSNKFEYGIAVDRPCVLLSLVSFDIVRFYLDSTERDTMTRDRFDMFLPELQYIGDQSLYVKEYDRNKVGSTPFAPFGYSTRYLEHKMSFPRAVGAFATDELPSWLFTAKDITAIGDVPHITPEFIRSMPSELDKYYLNGVGDRMSNYFHFILLSDCYFEADSPQVLNPQILG